MYLNKKAIILGFSIISILIIIFSTKNLNSYKVIEKKDKPNKPSPESYISNTDNLLYIRDDNNQEVFDLKLPDPKDIPICTELLSTN